AQELKGPVWVVKAQIHAGGRGKAGGVKLCKSLDEVRAYAKSLLGSNLATHQTGPKGQLVRKVYVECASSIVKEFYLSMVLNRNTNQVCIIASAEGGTDIEEVAESYPDKIVNLSISPATGIQGYHARRVAETFGIINKSKEIYELLNGIYETYTECDCSLIEINPLVVTTDGDLLALDAKVSFDDSALYRHESIQALNDPFEEEPAETEAKANDLSYVKLDGNIGCLVNGAGLAMATMDIIQHYGGVPANFLDVGGGADKERVCKAFQIILKDSGVKAILVNIFGGIMRCDIIAQGIIEAAKEMQINVPLIVRLQGTNNELGKKILSESGLNIIAADGLDEAAQKAVAALKG
ncbi:MAG: ADP-forming succinate--CoA ligase subunit beta, partial [Proteobacteria bacterium]|nr:ADP-forming succinate--CoA ligase subunit beta [Pseudomonadota bacterium]